MNTAMQVIGMSLGLAAWVVCFTFMARVAVQIWRSDAGRRDSLDSLLRVIKRTGVEMPRGYRRVGR